MDPDGLKGAIAGAQAGRPEAYQALLEAYWPRLYGYFLRATGNHHDAEDLLGEMALRLVRRLKSYSDQGRFDHWLFRIAANMARDRIRRLKVHPRVASLSAGDEDGPAAAERVEDESPAADSGLLAAEASAELNRALDDLDETTRQMILLRHFGQMSFKEIADCCQCPIGTVLARVHRGYKKLRELIGEEDVTD